MLFVGLMVAVLAGSIPYLLFPGLVRLWHVIQRPRATPTAFDAGDDPRTRLGEAERVSLACDDLNPVKDARPARTPQREHPIEIEMFMLCALHVLG